VTRVAVSSSGKITLPSDILKHLGVKAGGKLVVRKLPDGGLVIAPRANQIKPSS